MCGTLCATQVLPPALPELMLEPVMVMDEAGLPDAMMEFSDEMMEEFLHGRAELPGHRKHNKGVQCERCTLNTKLKHLRKLTGVYLTAVERPKPIRVKAAKRVKKERFPAASKLPRQRRVPMARPRTDYPESRLKPLQTFNCEQVLLRQAREGLRRVLTSLRTVVSEDGEHFLSDFFWEHPDEAFYPEYYAMVKRPISLRDVSGKLYAEDSTYAQQEFDADIEDMFAHSVERGVAFCDSMRLQDAYKRLMAEEGARVPRSAAKVHTVHVDDREEEELWQKSLQKREKGEKEEKRVIKQWAEDRDQAMANRWMFKRNRTTEEKRNAVELERLVAYPFHQGEEAFDDGAILRREEAHEDNPVQEVVIPVVIDHGVELGDCNLAVTESFQKSWSQGYIRYDPYIDELPPLPTSPRKRMLSPTARKAAAKPRPRGKPRSPHSTSTVPYGSPQFQSATGSPTASCSDGYLLDDFDEGWSHGKKKRKTPGYGYVLDTPGAVMFDGSSGEQDGKRRRSVPKHLQQDFVQ